jgi:hypothetical protein
MAIQFRGVLPKNITTNISKCRRNLRKNVYDNFFYCYFHVLGLFIPEKWVENKFFVCHSALPSGRWSKFVSTISQPFEGLQIWDFGYFSSFRLDWCTSYSEFWNFEISRANSGVRNFKISFEIFVKMLDNLNFGF